MSEFNRHVYRCAPEGFLLSDEEQDVIAERIAPSLQRWSQLPHVLDTLVEHNELNRSLTKGDIARREQVWEEAFGQRSYDNVEAWLDETLSEELAGWVAASDGVLRLRPVPCRPTFGWVIPVSTSKRSSSSPANWFLIRYVFTVQRSDSMRT